MGCVACITAVQGVLQKQFGLESVVDLNAGRVEIELNNVADQDNSYESEIGNLSSNLTPFVPNVSIRRGRLSGCLFPTSNQEMS